MGCHHTLLDSYSFDCIHPGYIRAFEEAKENCTILIVLLHYSNPNKPAPILSDDERVEILSAIRFIDEIYPYKTEDELFHILQHIKPDIRFLGSDYQDGSKPITGAELEIPIHYIDRSHGWSSTKYKKLIAESLEKNVS